MAIGASSRVGAMPSLAGRGIVVTRPRGQTARLAGLIEAAAGRAIVFPAIEILEAPDRIGLDALVDRLDSFDIAVFVSPTAVKRGLAVVRARRELPARLRVAAIGKGTARELAHAGIGQTIVPTDGADSEALLALPEFQHVSGLAVVVFRGEHGRELLGNTLAARGARVEYAQCYRRARPAGDAQALLAAWARGEIHAVTVTSAEALRNLYDLIGASGRAQLCATPMFAPHERIATAARALGIARVIVTRSGDEGLVDAMIEYFSGDTRA